MGDSGAMERLQPGLPPSPKHAPSSLSPSPSHTPSDMTPSPSRSSFTRRGSDCNMGATAAKTVVLFPGSGTAAAATLGAMGSIAAVATGGIAILGAGAVACAFKFSPSMNQESGMSIAERKAELEAANKVAEEERQRVLTQKAANRAMGQEDCLATVLSARDNHW